MTPAILNKPEIPASLRHLIQPREQEFTTGEFARLAGVSRRHIRTLCEMGEIKYRRASPLPCSHYLIPARELRHFQELGADQ